MFTWFKSVFSQKSHIDLWLVSDSLILFLVSAEISPSPLTDHAVVEIALSDDKFKRRRKVNPGYWKLNCTYLLSDSYCQEIKKNAERVKNQINISAILKWELFKYECRKFSFRFGIERVSAKNKEISDLITKMTVLLRNPNLGEDEKDFLNLLCIAGWIIFFFF